jgi:UDP-3-O-[3-hydroxymyristoyl] glucosamine N-acyltransferase
VTATTLTLAEVAQITGGRVMGDAATRIRGVAPLQQAGPEQLGLLSGRGYVLEARRSRAGALFVSAALVDAVGDDARPRVVVEDAQAALVPLLQHLHPTAEPEPGIHPTAVLGQSVSLGAGVGIGPYAVLGDDVVVGDGARVGPHVVVGDGCRVGEGSVLHPGVTLYPGTVLGRRVVVHSGARIGVDGFGYAFVDGQHRKVPQVGRAILEDDVEVGANTCVDRGSIGDTVVGAGSKLDNLVHIAHNVTLGETCAFAAQVGVAGSTHFGRGVLAGGQAGISGHLEIGDGARIAAQAGITGNVDPGKTVMGYPARRQRDYLKASALTYRLPDLFREVRALRKELERLAEEEGDV